MCGRFALLAPAGVISAQFNVAVPVEVAPRYNIAPTQPVAVVRTVREGLSDDPRPSAGDGDSGREFTFLTWGLIPSWSKDVSIGSKLINARSETAHEKPSFRGAFKYRRCLIPASGFFEWQKLGSGKQPMYITSSDEELLALAGLWERWSSPDGSVIESCTILTTEANELMEPIHNRMPVIVEPEDYSTWLIPGDRPDNSRHLLRPFPAERLQAYPVSKAVNDPRNDVPATVAPL
jgi:putative SOS response-associated peptidase YedK